MIYNIPYYTILQCVCVCRIGPGRSFCSENVITMDWIEGSKLMSYQQQQGIDIEDKGIEGIDEGMDSKATATATAKAELLQLLHIGIASTLRQLLETGVLHADPHPVSKTHLSPSPIPHPFLTLSLPM